MNHATGRPVSLDQHPHFPGNTRPATPEWPQLPTPGPVGTEKIKLTEQMSTDAVLRADDSYLAAFVTGPSPVASDWLAKTMDKYAGNPQALNMGARMVEVQNESRNDFGYGQGSRTTRLTARAYLLHNLPGRTLTKEEVGPALRMAKAARVPLEMLFCKDTQGERIRLVDHPGFAALSQQGQTARQL